MSLQRSTYECSSGKLITSVAPIPAILFKSSVTLQRSALISLKATPVLLLAGIPGSTISVMQVVSYYYYNTTAVTDTSGAITFVYAANSAAAVSATATDLGPFGSLSASTLGWTTVYNTINNLHPVNVYNPLTASEVNDKGIYLKKITNELTCASGSSSVRFDIYYTVSAY